MLTATRNWPTPGISFVLLGIAISLGAFGLLRVSWVETHALLPLTLAQAAMAVRLFGVPALPIDVTLACSGADVIALCLGAVLAFPSAWRHRLVGVAGGLGLIVALNVMRIGTLGRAAGSRTLFDALHLYVWPVVIALSIGAFMLMWMRAAPPALAATAADAKPPPLSRRFLALTGIFVAVFVATAPFFANSAAVALVTRFVAGSAASLLNLAGIYAFASGSTLWGAHGGFLVTGECVSTPLIPIYLSTVVAYGQNWRRRTLGLLATIPLFVALGVVRLLVVALPESAATQTFLIHAFYQLLVGAGIVFAAAYWHRRDTTAMAYGVAGIGAGTLVALVLGAAYLRVMRSLELVPLADPQGAIAFFPVFQTSLYIALCAAAFAAVGWTRFALGLLALVATQIVTLLALKAVLVNTAMTMAVMDVRAWALAVPVLTFVAVVTCARPRR